MISTVPAPSASSRSASARTGRRTACSSAWSVTSCTPNRAPSVNCSTRRRRSSTRAASRIRPGDGGALGLLVRSSAYVARTAAGWSHCPGLSHLRSARALDRTDRRRAGDDARQVSRSAPARGAEGVTVMTMKHAAEQAVWHSMAVLAAYIADLEATNKALLLRVAELERQAAAVRPKAGPGREP